MVRQAKSIELARAFLIEAKTDLESAKILLNAKKYGRVIFHCQQAVEKVVKALLHAKGFRVIKTHEVSPLLVMEVTREEVKNLGKLVEVVRDFELQFPKTRYPIPHGKGILIPSLYFKSSDAKRAIKRAEFVFNTISKVLKTRYGVEV